MALNRSFFSEFREGCGHCSVSLHFWREVIESEFAFLLQISTVIATADISFFPSTVKETFKEQKGSENVLLSAGGDNNYTTTFASGSRSFCGSGSAHDTLGSKLYRSSLSRAFQKRFIFSNSSARLMILLGVAKLERGRSIGVCLLTAALNQDRSK